MDLLTSHQVDATVEEEQSGDEEEENEVHGKATDTSSNKGSTIDTTAVPKLTDHNKISSTVVSSTTSNNKSSNVPGKRTDVIITLYFIYLYKIYIL